MLGKIELVKHGGANGRSLWTMRGVVEKSITGFLSPLFFSFLRLQLCVVVCGESQNSLHVYECVSLQFIDRMFLHQEKANYHFAF